MKVYCMRCLFEHRTNDGDAEVPSDDMVLACRRHVTNMFQFLAYNIWLFC